MSGLRIQVRFQKFNVNKLLGRLKYNEKQVVVLL